MGTNRRGGHSPKKEGTPIEIQEDSAKGECPDASAQPMKKKSAKKRRKTSSKTTGFSADHERR